MSKLYFVLNCVEENSEKQKLTSSSISTYLEWHDGLFNTLRYEVGLLAPEIIFIINLHSKIFF